MGYLSHPGPPHHHVTSKYAPRRSNTPQYPLRLLVKRLARSSNTSVSISVILLATTAQGYDVEALLLACARHRACAWCQRSGTGTEGWVST